jgi:hypothetical protein
MAIADAGTSRNMKNRISLAIEHTSPVNGFLSHYICASLRIAR